MFNRKKKIMRCDEVGPELSAYLDGEILVAEAEAIRRHIAGCPACLREAEGLEAAWKALDAFGVEDAIRVRSRVLAELRPGKNRLIRGRRVSLRPAFAAAILLAVVTGAVLLFRAPDRPDSGPRIASVVHPPSEKPAADPDQEIIASLHLLENRALLENLELLRSLEIIAVLEEGPKRP